VPYIKYRGGRPPDSIAEHLGYENPNASSYEGLAELSAEARRFAEENYSDCTERANAQRDYRDNHPYPGLKHVGGIGLVEAKVVRAIDEEITAEEYQTVRNEIEKANKEYKEQRASELSKNNDPLRRASSPHEQLGWRTRVWVTSYTELEHHVAYPLSEESVAYLRVRKEYPSGLTAQLIDIYHRSTGDIEQALLQGIDCAEGLVDLLALIGYGAATLANVVGTTVPCCRIGVEFQLATFGGSILNTPIPVRPDQFGKAITDPVSRLALRHLKDGLSAPIPTAAFAAFWNALERQAEEKARTRNLTRIVRCQSCGEERAAGWDLKSGFEAMYRAAGLDPSLFDRHRSKRGSIQHGAKLPTSSYMDEAFQDLSQLQTAAMVAVAEEVGIMPGTITYLSTNWPVTVFSCHARNDGTVDVQLKQASVRAAAGMLPQRICGNAGRTIQTGVSLPPKIDPLSLPPVQK
jgi:hypothetical protein